MKTAPEVAPTTAGAKIRPTEAVQTRILIMASGRAFHKEGSARALYRLPDRVQEVRPYPRRTPALPVPHLP